LPEPRRPVGLVAPLPPQLGGVASFAEWLLEHESEIDCHYRPFDLWRPPGDEAGGRVRLSSPLRQLRLLGRFVRWVPSSPRVVHYCAAVTRPGMARDLVYIALLRVARRRTIAHIQVVDEQSRLWRAAARALARLTVERVMISPWAVGVMERVGISARFVYNPIRIEPSGEESRRDSSELRLLFVGTYGRRKGCPELLDALAEVRGGGLAAALTLVGREEHRGEEEELRRRAGRLDVAHAVEFAGVMPRNRLQSVYQGADVFCLPSRVEGLPLALLEAMAFGLPVIATPVGGIPDVVLDGETGYLVEPGDAGALAAAIAKLAASGPLRESFGNAGRERVFRLAGAETIASDWRDLYARHEA
jgi:glycosyltransferase involved in cell wall biosynthesis